MEATIKQAIGFVVRRYRRFSVHYPLSYVSGNVSGNGFVANISERGWKISGDVDVRVGETLQLAVTCMKGEAPLQIDRATVLWVNDKEFAVQIEPV